MAPKYSVHLPFRVPRQDKHEGWGVPHGGNPRARKASLFRHEFIVPLAMSPMLVNRQYILNKVSLCKNIRNTRFFID